MKIVVQVHRCNEWRNVTSISFSPSKEKSSRKDGFIELSKKDALTEAYLALGAWRSSEQFTGCELRLALQSYYGRPEPIIN